MRMLLGVALVVVGQFGPTMNLRADDRADAIALLDEAIKAHGGADALAKAQNYTRTGKGTAGEAKVSSEQSVSLPDKSRLAIDLEIGGNKIRVVAVLNGDKGWESSGGPATEMTATRVREMNEEGYVLWATTLVPLKKDGVSLKVLPESKVDGKAALVVAASSKGRPDLRLYFDKESHLLVKIERETVVGGAKVDKEYLFGDYKEVDGVKLPGKMTELINGRKMTEISSQEYKLRKPEDSTFSRP
jgi:zinc protease